MPGGTLTLPRPLSAYQTPATGTPVLPPNQRAAQPGAPRAGDRLLLQYYRSQAKPGETKITIPMAEAARYFNLYPLPANMKAFGDWANQLDRAGLLAPAELRFGAEATMRKAVPNDPAKVRALQAALARRGYAVPTTGTFDAATERAVLAFKRAYNLTEPFRTPDGRPAVMPVADERTQAAILGGVIAR